MKIHNSVTYSQEFRALVCNDRKGLGYSWKEQADLYNSLGYKTVRGGLFSAGILISLTHRSVSRCG